MSRRQEFRIQTKGRLFENWGSLASEGKIGRLANLTIRSVDNGKGWKAV